jgi:outer membrane murein-binding lipoprotein Lpp
VSSEKWAVAAIEVMLIVSVCLLAGCAGSPAQKPAQIVTPDSTTAATLKDLQAQTVSLAQQNTAIINAIQKSAQDADQFRTEVKGSVASLTQNQFRFDSWWATVSQRIRPRLLGFGGFDAVVPAPGNDTVVGKPDGSVGGAGPADGGRASPVQVRKGPTMWELLIAFVLGAIASQVFAALEPQVEAKLAAEETSIYGSFIKLVHGTWAFIFGKKKTATPPKA